MSDLEEFSDAELLSLMQKDEMSAFIEIYNRYWDRLFYAAYKRVRNTEACEEIVQDIFISFWSKRNNLIMSVGLSNYFFTATKNQVIDYYRKLAIRNEFKSKLVLMDYDNSNEQTVLLRDLQRHVDELIEQFPDKCRSVYLMSRTEHKSNKEIAEYLNISEKTVEGHLSKAFKILRLHLLDYLLLALALFIKKF